MEFNSILFFLFLLSTLLLYYCIPKKYRIYLLLLSSIIFYSFLPIYCIITILLAILINYFCGILISNKSSNYRKIYLLAGISLNILILIIFKYIFFFSRILQDIHLIDAFSAVSLSNSLILPLGISFYTFSNLSYLIDIFRSKLEAEKNIIVFSTFIIFFPKIAMGPIERGSDLIPQLTKFSKFNSYCSFQDLN